MRERTALPAPVSRTEPITHPKWCERGACVNDEDSDNVSHRQRLSRWEAMDGDVRLEVALVADDEHPVWDPDGQWIPHPAGMARAAGSDLMRAMMRRGRMGATG